MAIQKDAAHPLLPDPHRWELLEFAYRRDPADPRESFIDMVFARDGRERRLRFFGPQDLEISGGMPNSGGMYIADVRGRQLEGLTVQVGNFDQPYGAPTFWAATVIEVLGQTLA